MSIQTRASSVTVFAPGTPAPSVTLMWAETPFSVLLASSGYTSAALPSPVLTFAQSVQLALQWVGVARRAPLKVKLAPLLRPIPSLRRLHPLHPFSRVPPLPPGFYQPRPPQGPPRYPSSLYSHEVGNDSLKCSTCSKWVHFSCSSLTRANFRKICADGSTMGWNCPACLNGYLVSPTYQQASSRPISPIPPPPTPPTNMFRCNGFISTSPFTSSLLNTYPLSAFTLPSTPPSTPSTTRRRTLNELHAPLKTLEFYSGMLAVFPPHVVLN